MLQKPLHEEWRELEPWVSWWMRVGPLRDTGGLRAPGTGQKEPGRELTHPIHDSKSYWTRRWDGLSLEGPLRQHSVCV